jgi:hypothetical protein
MHFKYAEMKMRHYWWQPQPTKSITSLCKIYRKSPKSQANPSPQTEMVCGAVGMLAISLSVTVLIILSVVLPQSAADVNWAALHFKIFKLSTV